MGITLVMGSPKRSGHRLIWTVFDEVNASDRPISVPRIAGNPGPSNRALRRTRWQVRPAQHPSPTVRVLAPASPAPQRSTRRTRRARRPLPAAAPAICDTMTQARSPDSGTRKARELVAMRPKGEQRLPRQTDLLSAVECLSEPVPTTLVSGRTRVVRIEQDIRVEDDHRLSGPSIRSSSSSMLSSETPGGNPPKLCDSIVNCCFGRDRRFCRRPARKASLTSVLKGRPVRRASALSRAATSSSSVSVVRTS